jgi:DNA-binding PadR family transcriptional regulator
MFNVFSCFQSGKTKSDSSKNEMEFELLESFIDYLFMAIIEAEGLKVNDTKGKIYEYFGMFMTPSKINFTIRNLEKEGFITQYLDNGDEIYKLTEKGKGMLNNLTVEYDEMDSLLDFMRCK